MIEDALAIEAESAREAGAIGYMARVLAQITLPHRDPKATFFQRSNGNLTVTISNAHGRPLPSGTVPRMVLAWVTSEVVRTKKAELVLGDSLSDFMRQIDMVPTGGRWGSITRLREQLGRLFDSTIGVSEALSDGDLVGERASTMRIAKSHALWWDPKNPEQTSLFNSTVTLAPEFVEQILDRPVPIDMRALAALKQSPLGLDVYVWLTYRLSYLMKPVAIPWALLQQQFGAGYPNTDKGRNNFQQALRALARVFGREKLHEAMQQGQELLEQDRKQQIERQRSRGHGAGLDR